MSQEPLTPEELDLCLSLMQRAADGYRRRPPGERFDSLVRKLHRQAIQRLHRERLENRHQRRREDQALLATSRMVQTQRDAEPQTALPPPGREELHEPEDCYVCKQPYTQVHFFYHYLCPTCAAFNYTMRNLHADLRGWTALVTGGRVKIGYQLVLRLLQDGARVLVTTRFPHAAARRFQEEPDSAEWIDRLELYGLDLRNLPAVEEFAAQMLAQESHLDILVHNAAQTIQRPPGFYHELLQQEESPQAFLPPAAQAMVRQPAAMVGSHSPTALAVSGPVGDMLPLQELHDHEERVDNRDVNSWLLPIDRVGTRELLEVQLVNSVAPFMLTGRLKPLLLRSPHERRFVVNVSAMEGQFSRHKTPYHPHTNMAKAALNMMTHTCAGEFARDRIYMNSVDTGWVTDENPTPRRQRKQEELGFFAPLDVVDGMARIYHPVAVGVSNPDPPFVGQFLKDYAPCKW